MIPKVTLVFATAVLLGGTIGCTPSPFLPEGDVAAGRQAFQDLGCHNCHRVHGEDLPDPVARPDLPFVLSSPSNPKTKRYIAESIIAPSHQFARKPPVYTEPGIVADRDYENVREGDESRMGSFNDHLTVQQWLDLVEFLHAAQKNRSY